MIVMKKFNLKVVQSYINAKHVYVCSPFRGNVSANIEKALEYAHCVYSNGCVPVTPHTLFLFLDDDRAVERKHALEMDLSILERCDEVWVFSKQITEGMAREIDCAKRMGIPVYSVDCEDLA